MILKLLEQRAPRTICPSEAARLIVAKAWREWMPAVREATERLAKRGRLDVLQKGEKVDLKRVSGPIRLGLAAAVDVYRRIDFRRQPELYRVGRGVAELPFPSKSEQPDGDGVAAGLFAGSG